MFRVCHAVLSDHCSLVVTCWERANLLAILCVMFSCVFVTFPSGVLCQLWYLIVLIPDLCLLPYFDCISNEMEESISQRVEMPGKCIIAPRHEISNNVVCSTSKASDQPVHTRSLIRAFATGLHIL